MTFIRDIRSYDTRSIMLRRALLIGAVAHAPVLALAADNAAMPAPATGTTTTTTTKTTTTTTTTTPATATTDDATAENLEPADPKKQQAAVLIEEAINIAYREREARPALARGAAPLLPRLQGRTRMGLTNRWVELVSTSAVPRGAQLAAFNAFFDVAAMTDPDYGRSVALMLSDPASRAGAFVRLSEATENKNWDKSAEFASLAQRAARQESDPVVRARALVYVANRLASLNPETRGAAIVEASSQARLVHDADLRESMLAGLAGSAAKFDIPLAQRIAASLTNENMKNLALARIAASQAQAGFAVKKPDPDRVAAIVKGVSRYDTSFIPVLLQLPATPEVFQALGDALPPIYAGATPAIDVSTLERVWAFTEKAEPSVYRDQLQSRAARLMVALDLWRGRAWGEKLSWQGGRDRNAEFVESTLRARESQLQAEPLRTVAAKNINAAIGQARQMEPTERVEALLLIAGQILNPVETQPATPSAPVTAPAPAPTT